MTWTANQISAIAISDDRQFQAVLSDTIQVFYSLNEGESWESVVLDNTYNSAAVSGNGKILVLGSYQSGVILSNNYATTFNPTMLDAQPWSQLAASSSGKYVVAIVSDTSNVSDDPNDTGSIWLSNDFGINWLTVLTAPATYTW